MYTGLRLKELLLLDVTDNAAPPRLDVTDKAASPWLDVTDKAAPPRLDVTDKAASPLLDVCQQVDAPRTIHRKWKIILCFLCRLSFWLQPAAAAYTSWFLSLQIVGLNLTHLYHLYTDRAASSSSSWLPPAANAYTSWFLSLQVLSLNVTHLYQPGCKQLTMMTPTGR